MTAAVAATVRPSLVRSAPPPRQVDRAARAAALRLLRQIEGGTLTVVEPNGSRLSFGASGDLDVTLTLTTPAVWRAVLTGGSAALGRTYVDGWWRADDLPRFVQLLARNLPRLDRYRNGVDFVVSPVTDGLRRLRREDRDRDRRNIRAHYDLGNDFFARFLDPTMTYSCALFESPEVSLEQAQRAKYDRLCRALQLAPGEDVLEIGSGWGGFAVHAAEHFGVRVTTTTISAEQFAYATELVASRDLADRVTVLHEDYRELRGRHDAVASIEMIEAVDWREYDTYFATCARLLAPSGRMGIQAITIADQRFERAKTSQDFIKQYIFPGGCLPSVAAITRSLTAATDLVTTGLDDFGLHYAETLARWRSRLLASSGELRADGYDDALQRLWDFYFSYCEGAFRERHVSLIQATFAKPAWRPRVLSLA
jgi:cyclopropane-fatty-acyl-phospholipid synthase